MISTILILFSFLPFFINSQCSGSSCNDCTSKNGCGWCASTQSCLNGTSNGPDSSICQPRSWFYAGTSHSCPVCSTLIGCTSCTDNIACGWLTATQTCTDSSDPLSTGFCPCEEYEQCTDCTRGGCNFCANTGKCQSDLDSCITITNCGCSQISDCAVCVEQDDICGWCSDANQCQSLLQLCSSGEGDTCNMGKTINISFTFLIFIALISILI